MFQNAGVYDVTLIATGPSGADTLSLAAYVTAEDPVTAAFSASLTTGAPPLSVDFTNLSVGAPTSWLWDFGDAATDAVQNPTHVYAADGTYTVSLTATNGCGTDTSMQLDLIVVSSATDVASRVFAFEHNVPNPFNPSTVIAFSLERDGRARLEIFDAAGHSLGALLDREMPAGRHEVTWRPVRQPSGVYFARLTSGDRTAIQRMVLVR
ncbi:PKD domain-containing protein [bacterium]|nr:PKD domain-containing protein [bacterium]MBU1676444.1 PKD domain-containing protein [bacterium]